ncbi:gliding motility-associated C-terminal domain-containing protein [Terrimonas sp. NA20]|uniref:Gliding motility-associated C-terminal domain-containing protein n=1 Tax=Terrimonas ginsenosidimutans TaxID=2908004 RepID=A0ABS9KTP9_9BACT|nr:gliding motility-associated C-terminal domain-containing protein [Terrimonas ginsenosidimutans]
MKRAFLILLLTASSVLAWADHITGGEMFYTHVGANTYNVTLKLFMRCNSGRNFPDPAVMSIFDKTTNQRFEDISVRISNRETISLTNNDPCITNPPEVCYDVAYYNFTVSLPGSPAGYIIASEVNYRIRGINNLAAGNQVGATYTCDIPGIADASNNSARFSGSDLVMVCADNYFSYSFAAKDADNDNLIYSFCSAYNSTTGGVNGVPAGNPPYSSVPYAYADFTESAPLGSKVHIDPSTGLISGVAPAAGIYVVTVCVSEIRDGDIIAVQRKDLQINITDCSIAAANLEDDYMLCGTTRSIVIDNRATSPLIVSYEWLVFDPAGTAIFTATTPSLSYTFPVNGTYNVQLIVNKGQPCTDTARTKVYVYPGLVPDFNATGVCINNPTVFRDQSTVVSGSIALWAWDFGEPSVFNDASNQRHPVYKYPFTGDKYIRLIVTTTDGCRDTVEKKITMIDKPPITLAFKDTLICRNDQLPLQATGTGIFTWSPGSFMSATNISNPVVSPPVSTLYYVELNTDGCINKDSVQVRVVDQVTLIPMNDTTICSGDTIQLRINSNGLKYAWTPAAQLFDPLVQNPRAVTPATTSYAVTATIGGCSATAAINVRAVPYPVARASADTTVCYNDAAFLTAITDGNSWSWSPASYLSNAGALNPVASPPRTTAFVFSAYENTRGCPKPGRDTVLVTVLPKIIPFAGNDTSVITGQPLQLQATGGVKYNWSPPYSLSATNISNPVATIKEPSENIVYKVDVYNRIGCYDSAFVSVKVYSSVPTIFVPSAFTPNNDGKNDLLIPVLAGMKQMVSFNIYNRWGQLVFSTSAQGHGWDGRINGQFQSTNTYVWMVNAIDYLGKHYSGKGMVTLVR